MMIYNREKKKDKITQYVIIIIVSKKVS